MCQQLFEIFYKRALKLINFLINNLNICNIIIFRDFYICFIILRKFIGLNCVKNFICSYEFFINNFLWYITIASLLVILYILLFWLYNFSNLALQRLTRLRVWLYLTFSILFIIFSKNRFVHIFAHFLYKLIQHLCILNFFLCQILQEYTFLVKYVY